MNEVIKQKLKEAQEFCEENEKSTAFMLQYMQDYAGVDLDTVIKYLTTYGGFEESNDDIDESDLEVI